MQGGSAGTCRRRQHRYAHLHAFGALSPSGPRPHSGAEHKKGKRQATHPVNRIGGKMFGSYNRCEYSDSGMNPERWRINFLISKQKFTKHAMCRVAAPPLGPYAFQHLPILFGSWIFLFLLQAFVLYRGYLDHFSPSPKFPPCGYPSRIRLHRGHLFLA